MSGCDNFDFEAPQDDFWFGEGLRGADGTTFYPHVSAEGVLSWTNDGGKPNPAPVNIKGADGTPGKSAYAAAQEAGFTGTEAEFNAYLSGIGDLTQEVADQKSALNQKAGLLRDTASGAIASFVPDSTVPDLLGVSVAVEPVQDLHGQASPWPAGGGKNICPIATMSTTNGGYINSSTGIVGAVIAGTQYTLSFKNNTPSTANIVVRMLVSGAWTTLTEGNLVAQGTRAYTFTPSNDGDVSLSAYLGTNYAPAFSDIQLEIGSTATAYAPYSNICPISGWSEVGIEATGANLCYKVLPYVCTLVGDDNRYARILASPGTSACFKCVEGETYIVSGAVGRNRGLVAYFDSDPDDGSVSVFPNTTTVTAFADGFRFTAEHTAYAVCYLANTVLADVNIQIERGSTATAYAPFDGNTYTIALGQTVYGGTLDVTNGTLTVDRKLFQSADPSLYRRNSSTSFYAIEPADIRNPSTADPSVLSNRYPSVITTTAPGCWINPGGAIRFTTTTEYATVADMLAGEGTIQFVYPLATPIEITLTPTQIATISGQTNNVWADAGDVSVTYAADVKTYIDSKIAAAVAALS